MDYSNFFDVADGMKTQPVVREFRLYYNADGAIIDCVHVVASDAATGDYIVITQEQFDAIHQKRHDYTVVDNKVEFTPPKPRGWHLTQEQLSRNPYTCKM